MTVQQRAIAYRALGDPMRLAIVEALACSDRTPSELRDLFGIQWNLLAFHLKVLETATLVTRRSSDADGRRRYVCLRPGAVPPLIARPGVPAVSRPLFVCTHNAARSQFAAALWRRATGTAADSAGSNPASRVHPMAVRVAKAHGLDLSASRPQGYREVRTADLVVSVCDRARESGIPSAATSLHWSVPDPIGGTRGDFERVFADIEQRISRLATAGLS